MKTAIMAALAALSFSAWAAPALARDDDDRGRRDRGERHESGDRGRGRDHDDHGRDGRDWGHEDRGRHGDWDRHDRRGDRGHHGYSDWRGVRHGAYFDHGHARLVGGFYGRDYYGWSQPYGRRPHRAYTVGYVLPRQVYWRAVPTGLYDRLPPTPYGCRYVLVDRDVLLIVASTGLVLDALMYY